MAEQHNPTASRGSLEPSLVQILLAIHTELGSLRAASLGNRQAIAQQMATMQSHLDTRIEDLHREVFARFQRTDATMGGLERRLRRTEQPRRKSLGAMVWGIAKFVPLKHTLLLLGIWIAALIGILSPAEMAAGIKGLLLPAPVR